MGKYTKEWKKRPQMMKSMANTAQHRQLHAEQEAALVAAAVPAVVVAVVGVLGAVGGANIVSTNARIARRIAAVDQDWRATSGVERIAKQLRTK